MSDGGSWLDALPEPKWEDDLSNPKSVRCPSKFSRFWIPKGKESNIIFLTNQPKVVLWEHQIKIAGDFRNWATCLRHLGMTCPLCTMEHPNVKVYRAGLFTVIDKSEYVIKKGDKAGETIKNQRRILVAKKDVWEKLARRAKKREEAGQSLLGAEYTVTRGTGDKSSNTGDDFEFVGMADMSKFEDTAELDYGELFKPDVELVKKYINALKSMAGSPETEDESLPF